MSIFGQALRAACATALLLSTTAADAQDWKARIPVIRIGILGGENAADRLTNYACWKDKLEAHFNVPVELFPAADYAGVIQGLLAGQLDIANAFSPNSYASIVSQDPDAVEAVATQRQTDGSLGYYSVIIARKDSGLKTVADLKGKTLAFADPNSTSGYLYPSFELKAQGYDPATFFAKTGFAGGHEQGVVAVLNKQYDAAATWSSAIGDESKGYSSGNLAKMVQKGALNMKDIVILWKSSLIPNGPELVRKALPADFKAEYAKVLFDLPKSDKTCFDAIEGGDFADFAPIPAGFYDTVIRMRQEQDAGRRKS
ncbi:phosphonate transport system substrate-binding protein [Arboricoccus pini]|uniref:Phosphonate transport system substrate-binding protein n=1 Tax=Arboricoccus pini TaxID=1963835 RepID=A0A212RZH3_9PROT|nr:phosphonate ABC transporter substrate-binding protein [Arboricoccus pini]SNB78208.1 phosphonate transport system substrate-binding protein [Arboricoccus pini]